MKRLLLILLVAFTAQLGYSQCQATFVDTSFAPNQVFYMSTYNTIGSTHYQWSFPGGNPSSVSGFFLDTVTVSYNSPGWYYACLTIIDTVGNCTDSICDSVYVTGFNSPGASISNVNNTSCGACNGSMTANASGGQAPYSYMWSNGTTTASINNLCAGVYTVTITDANNLTATAFANVAGVGGTFNAGISVSNSCDSAVLCALAQPSGYYTYQWSNGSTAPCIGVWGQTSATYHLTTTDTFGCTVVDSTIVNFSNPISASISGSNETCQSCCDGSASVTASGGSGSGFTYSWSNGATTQNISSLCPSWYHVTVTDNNSGCTEVQSISVLSACPYYLSGQVTPLEPATVYLIEENGGVLSLVDSVNIDSGYYTFGDICPGTYYVKAALRPSSSVYNNFQPTYYVQAALWGSANSINVNSNNWNVNITLLAGLNTGGPGFIGGLISQGANRGEGDPIAGAEVYLMNANDEVIASTTSDANGEYSFDDIALGEYKVMVDLLNYTPYPHTVTLTNEDPEQSAMDFTTEGNTIKPVGAVGISSVNALEDIQIYPNPASDRLLIDGEGIESLAIFNLVGQQVLNETNSGKTLIELNVENLEAGQYIIQVNTAEGSNHQTIVIQ